jgi:large subunit ribosomal protein L29
MRSEEIRDMSPQELEAQVSELEEELFQLRIQNETGQLDNPLRLRHARRDLARCKTIQRESQVAGTEAKPVEEGGE